MADFSFNGSTPEPIAIVGMACAFPGAPDLAAFWRLIASGQSALRDVPPSRLIPEQFGLKTRRGGFIDEPLFDPLPLGIMPAALDDGDAEQFLLLSIVHSALRDAGIESLREQGERAEIVVGRGGYINDAGEVLYMGGEGVGQILELLRGLAPELSAEKIEELRGRLLDALPQLSSEALACAIPNLLAGRVANRLDCQGPSYTVDGACASSLLAIDHVVRDLRGGRCNIGLAAGIHLMQKPYFWRAFETLDAVSSREEYAPFDAQSDGLMMGEGVGALVLKRLSDAVADGDRVYCLVKSIGVSSDGRGQALMAPRREGQVLALRRAYEEAGVEPETIGLIEAHGTGTTVGDATEIDTLHEYFGFNDEGYPAVALGTVKSQIGHAMPAAGMAGVIKAALAIAQGILPPTINVKRPHPKLKGSRFYLNNALRPWLPIIRDGKALPLRAGVNAFGFGGINAHAVLEAPSAGGVSANHTLGNGALDERSLNLTPRRFEIFVLAAASRGELLERLQRWQGVLAVSQEPVRKTDEAMRDMAFSAWIETRNIENHVARIAIVTSNLDDLRTKLEYSITQLAAQEADWTSSDGVYFREGAPVQGKLAVLFPGIGFPGLAGGYTTRLAELCLHFPPVRQAIIDADIISADNDDEMPYPLRYQLFPPPFEDRATLTRIERELGWSSRTMPGMMGANLATWELLRLLHIEPDALAGFSLGEWSAMVASETIVSQELMEFLGQMARADDQQFSFELDESAGAWAMIAAPPETVEAELQQIEGTICVTIDTSPHQVFIGGDIKSVAEAVRRFKSRNIWAQQMPFPAVHTPLATGYVERLRAKKHELSVGKPRFPVYHGASGEPYPDTHDEVLDCLFGGIAEPVHVRQTVSRLYKDGVRVFIQVGSGGKMLANLRHTFGDKPYESAAMDLDHRSGLEQFLHCAAQLFSCGVSLSLDEIFARRGCRDLYSSPQAVPASARRLSLSPPRLHASESTLDALRAVLTPSTHVKAIEPNDRVESNRTQNGDANYSAPISAAPLPVHNPVADAMLTMQQFLAIQNQHEAEETALFSQYLQTQSALLSQGFAAPEFTSVEQTFSEAPPARSTAAVLPFPLLGEIIRHEPGQSLTTRLVLNLEQHQLLQDHCLLRLPEELGHLKPVQERLPTLPMTGSLEVLCEAATALAPGWQVVACHDIEARRWIALESVSEQAIQVHARCVRAEESEVEIAVEIRTEKSGVLDEDPALRGHVTLRHEFPAAPAPVEVLLDRACPRPVEDYYYNGPLFHGPRFHVIRELRAMSDEAVEAMLEVPDPQQLFAAPLQVQPILDAALVDGLGQVLGYPVAFDNWAVFPQRLERLERFAPTPPVGSRVRCVVRYKRLDARRLLGDVEAFDESGRMWLRISNWLDWRVLWPKDFLKFDYDPREAFVAAPYEFAGQPNLSCRTISRAALNGVNPDWFARLYLRPNEWQEYSAAPRLDWLLGRIAAKDAIRDFLNASRGLLLHPLEIELGNEAGGRPLIIEPQLGIELSISHLEEEAIAAVSHSAVGIDIARREPRGPEWIDLAFSSQERALLGESEEALLRAWCAKEAAAKARGLGLESLPQFRVTAFDTGSGVIEIYFAPLDVSTPVQTRMEKNRALALCVDSH